MEISYDPDIVNQWGLYNNEYEGMDISISNAWCYSSGKGVRIAIVDQGVDVNHIDLAKNIYMSYDCSTRTSPTASYGNHGTHCAGIVAAVRNNGIQITGVAPDAKLMAAGVDFGQPNASTSLADGINWAWENGADIISCSWKSPDLDIIRNALDNAIDKGRNGRGCVVVKSAGNSSSEITFPGSYRKEVIAVANLTKSGVRSNSSCFGENLLVAAPGTNILSTINGDKIGYMSGTSMACPHVSGIAALILERNEDLSVLEVREILAKSTKKVGDKPYDTNKEFGTWNKWYGYGMIDACKAVLNTKRK
jgi:subtilisin family serine protease